MATTNASGKGGTSGANERRQSPHAPSRGLQQQMADVEDAMMETPAAPDVIGTRSTPASQSGSLQRIERDQSDTTARVIEMTAPRDRLGRDGNDVPPGPVGQASEPLKRTTSGPATSRREPLPLGVPDETDEDDERNNTTDVFASISRTSAVIAQKVAGVAQDLLQVAHEQAVLGNHTVALDLMDRADALADVANEVSETSRAASEESVQAMIHRQQEHLLTARLSTVRGACDDLNQAAQHTKELSVETKAFTEEYWKQADSGLETLHVAINERRIQVRLEPGGQPLVSAVATAAEHLIVQAAVAVGNYLQHIWQLVVELAREALLRLTYISLQPLLAPLGAHPLHG